MFYFLIIVAVTILQTSKGESNKTVDNEAVTSNAVQVLPYVLRTSNIKDIKDYRTRFVGNVIGKRQKPDLLDVEEEDRKEVGTKPTQVDLQNWDRVAHYAHTPFDGLQTWSSQGHATSSHGFYGSPAIPTALFLLLNLGILSYIIIGVLSALSRILAAVTAFYGHGGHFYEHFRNIEDESIY